MDKKAVRITNEQVQEFFHGMLHGEFTLPPSAFESCFLNDALSYHDLEETIKAAGESLKELDQN